jgi:hypothetical protein
VVHDAITREPPYERKPDPTAPEWMTVQYRQGVLVPQPNKVTLPALQDVAYRLRRAEARVHFMALGLSTLRWGPLPPLPPPWDRMARDEEGRLLAVSENRFHFVREGGLVVEP